ncbi:MAG: translation initiation factor IF-2 [Bacteroidales bacterium]|nr:translation initiation factor IF-2 [Bacteroidales bacterium]
MTNVEKSLRLSKLAREFNVGISTIVEFLHKKGHKIPSDPNSKVDAELYNLLAKEYGAEVNLKMESQKVSLKGLRDKKETVSIEDVEKVVEEDTDAPDTDDEEFIKNILATPKQKEVISFEKPKIDLKVKGKIDLNALSPKKQQPVTPKAPEVKPKQEQEIPKPVDKKDEKPEVVHPKVEKKPEHISTSPIHVEQPKVIGKVDLDQLNQKTRPTHNKQEQHPNQKQKYHKQGQEKQGSEKHGHEKHGQEKKQATGQETNVHKIHKPVKIIERPKPAEEIKAPVAEAQESIVKVEPQEAVLFRREVEKLSGPTVVGKINLEAFEIKKKQPVASSNDVEKSNKKKRRKRIRKDNQKVNLPTPHTPGQKSAIPPTLTKRADLPARKNLKKKKKIVKQEVSEEAVQKQIKETLARLTSKGKTKGSKYRREKRDLVSARQQQEFDQQEIDKNTLKVTEFVSASELASMMNVSPKEVIEVCMNLGLMVSINQRLDAETMALVADEFSYKVEFVSVELQEAIKQDEDLPEDLVHRSPIVTVMGHVDHGKTSLLDYIRHTNVIAGEAGGITQHIGAYNVEVKEGKHITFLDTPGHEAFTAMRARGAKITDVAIIVVSADDAVMPQTIEAINHASAAGVPIVFAINKVDKPNADPEKIKQELANMNYLVEDWGGKYQSQEISAKKGTNIEKLLDKVLLEAEMLDLKANPQKKAQGTVVESTLDKGRGYTATVLVHSGTLKQGDIMIAGINFGHVKAMFNERGNRINEAGPSMPVQVIGLNGAPQAGDYFNVMETDREAKEIANKREQLQRMQGLRTQKHITLDEIGRRIAIGNFQELNIIVKGDVDGSIEALADSLIKLSTPMIQVNVIHKAVGQISESDILLAAASNAIVIGFQVRPSIGARRLAEKEEIDIRLYSIIYSAINEIKDAMEGMLSPELKEEIIGTTEVLEVFKITKVGTIAGCIVREGKIIRNNKVRLIRDGIVVYTGDLESLKRFKDDAKEILNGFECGLNIKNFNDIKVGDIIESFQEVEVKRKL